MLRMMTEAAGPAARATAAKTVSADASETSPASSVSVTFAAPDAESRACVHSNGPLMLRSCQPTLLGTHMLWQRQ